MAGFPDVAFLVSSADPNDPAATDSWTDLAAGRVMRVPNAGRGRQYELDQVLAGRMLVDLRNVDEYLNPANVSSPLASLARPMRRVRWMAMYPPGGVGNLLNPSNPLPQQTLPFTWGGQVQDGSFESYADGFVPPWILKDGGPNPQVTSVNPQQGTKCLTFSMAGNSSQQSVGFNVATIPGRLYTAQMQVRQTAGNSLIIFVGNGPVGPSTTAVNTYIRLSVTFTATQPVSTVWVASVTPTVAATVNLDALMVEPAYVLNPNPNFETDTAGWFAKGGTVTRSTAQAHGGAASLLLTPDGVTATVEVNSDPLSGMAAGQTARIRGWVRCAAARNINVNINWFGASGYLSTSTGPVVALTANTWTLIDFAAVAPAGATGWSFVVALTGTPPSTHLLWLDEAVMVTVSPFTTTGPRIRGLWGGHIDRLPVTWEPGTNGYAGRITMPCVGPFAALAQLPMHSDFVEAILSKTPKYYWPLWDGFQATAWSEVSGNGGPLLQAIPSKYGPGQGVSSGSAITIPGDPGASGVQFTPDTPQNSTTQAATLIGVGSALTRSSQFAFPFTADTIQAAPFVNVTMAAYITLTQAPAPRDLQFIAKVYAVPPNITVQRSIGLAANTAGNARAEYYGPLGVRIVDSTTPILDGKPHLVVMTLTAGGLQNVCVLTLYVDGVQVGQSSGTTIGVGVSTLAWTNLAIGGQTDGGVGGGTLFNLTQQGTVAHVALWTRVLSSQELGDLAAAAKGYAGEPPGTRIRRYLANNYVGPAVIDPGVSKMGPPTATEGSMLLPAVQRIADSDGGTLFENRDGAPEFDDRNGRYLRTVPQAVFGENTSAGEIPYADGAVYTLDTGQVTNQASISQTGGIKAIAGPDLSSQRSYYTRGYSQQVDLQSPYEVQDRASWVVANRSQPQQRLEVITLNPGANPALWPTILDLEIGQRYTVIRRPKAANNGAGLTMTGDFYLENVAHRGVDPELGTWWVDLILSPAPLQPWILGDPTYGQLGITTILGY